MTRKMKDSGIEWIGEIPEDWEVTKLKQLASFHNGDRGKNYPSGNDLVDEGVYFLTSNNIHGYYLDIDKSISKFITNERLNVLNGAKIQINDIVFCLRGSVGNCSINKSLEKGTIASSLMLIRPINIDADFLNYIMQSDIKVMEVLNLTTGSCAANLSAINVSNFKILQPSLSEQMKISNYLNKKTERIEDIKSTIVKQIQTLENYKKSVITEAVTKGLDKNVEMKDSGIEWIGEIPKHWDVIPLKHICKITMGQSVNGSDILDEKKGYPFLQGCAEFTEYIPSPRYWSTKAKKIIDKGSLLMSVRAPVGDVNIADQTYGIGRGLCAFNGINNKYIYYILISSNSGFLFYSNGTTYDAITVETLKNFKVPYSSINEQDEIVAYLDKKCTLVDSAISKKQKQLETLEEYKKSLIYEYVTGKKEVKDGEES